MNKLKLILALLVATQCTAITGREILNYAIFSIGLDRTNNNSQRLELGLYFLMAQYPMPREERNKLAVCTF
jgi:hypothetical protein